MKIIGPTDGIQMCGVLHDFCDERRKL